MGHTNNAGGSVALKELGCPGVPAMRKPIFVGYLIAATILLAQTQAAGLPPPEATSLLIRYRSVRVDFFPEVTSTYEALIFRDGLIIERRANSVGECQVVRASALPEKLSRLNVTLRENKVGLQQGDCISETPGDFRTEREVSWFGRGARQHSYRHGFGDSFAGSVPPEIIRIDLAIADVLFNSTGRQTAQTCP